MNKKLLKQFEVLETQRAKLMSLVAPLSDEQLNIHPEGKWSIAQVLSHLIASEHLSVNYLNKKMQGIEDIPNTGLREELVMATLIVSQRLPFIKFKAPKVVAENTHVYHTMEQLKEAWNKGRAELKEVLNRFEDSQLQRKIYKHPIAGKLNIQQTLRFFQEHIIHHTPQIKKLLSQN